MNEEAKQRLSELSEMLAEGVKAFRNSQQWMEYLRMQSRMPKYSFNNTILILMQSKGQATMCQSFTGWKSMDRSVKRGEKGLKIICPTPYKRYEYEPKRDENGNVIKAADGSVVKEKICHTMQGYKVGYTFDVSQTEGKELPEICRHLDGSVEGAEELIGILQEIAPVPMHIEPIDIRANGYYSPTMKTIVVDNGLSPNMKIKTGIHEIAHAVLNLSGADNGASRELKETEAESIAFVVMSHLMGDKMSAEEIGSYSFGYLNSWASSDDLTEMKQAMSVIQRTSADIIDRIEAVYAERNKTVEKTAEKIAEQAVQHKAAHM